MAAGKNRQLGIGKNSGAFVEGIKNPILFLRGSLLGRNQQNLYHRKKSFYADTGFAAEHDQATREAW
jgi:hypothetical protein